MLKTLALSFCVLFLFSPSSAQENRAVIDKARMPLEASAAKDFVPAGWAMEEQVSGDLNGDATPDYALKLVEDKPKAADGVASDRQRALIILFTDRGGKLRRVAIAENLLLCTSCGGALYGMLETPANVKIEKGVLIVNQDYGSREVEEQTFRFRYDPRTKKMLLIGLDISVNDRATGELREESTNFITGVKTIKRSQFSQRADKYVVKSNARKRVARSQLSIEQVDSSSY